MPVNGDRRILKPAVAEDIAIAWEVMDEQARRAAEIRDLVAKAWRDVEEITRVRELSKVRDYLQRAIDQVDKAIAYSQLSASDKQKMWRNQKYLKRQAGVGEVA
jgi:hypothetical protein